MALSKTQLRRLLEAIRAHVHWLQYTVVGDSPLTEADLKAFQKYNLPQSEVNLITSGYTLGLLRMFMKKSEYSHLTFDQLLDHAKSQRTYTEEAAVNQALISAGNYMKGLAQDIADNVFTAVTRAGEQAVTEATIKDSIRDDVAFAVIKRDNYMKLASDLSHNLGANWKRDWRRVAETELVRAKVMGQVQALVNKKDIYAHSEGKDSRVSVVPSHDCCKDCFDHYLDRDRNPKIFELSWLMAQGSNGDEGVSHRKVDGKHVHWKTTLPPLHPRCGCRIVYIPPGYGWVDGRLTVVDAAAYRSSLTKALEPLSKAKEYTPFSPTAKPLGPEATKAAEPGQPSMPGTESTSKTPKPGGAPKAPTPGKPAEPDSSASGGDDLEDCPLGMAGCQAEGGSGRHHKNSATLEKHRQLAQQRGSSQQSQPQDNSEERTKQALAVAANYKPSEHSPEEVRQHLSSGRVAVAEVITGSVSKPAKLTIEGNGAGIFKRPRNQAISASMSLEELHNIASTEMLGVVAENTGHKREVAAYDHAVSYGSKIHPVTTYRTFDGSDGSIQAEAKGFTEVKEASSQVEESALGQYCKKDGEGKPNRKTFNYASYLMDKSSDKEHAKTEICRSIVHDLMTNHTDRHVGNMMFKHDAEGKLNLQMIDNADSFGRGYQGLRNMMFTGMHSAGYKVTIPEDMQKQMEVRSFSDELRTVGPHVSKKEAAETFLRTKYLVHLQKTEGHLDHNHFIGVLPTQGADPYDRDVLGSSHITDQLFDKGDADTRFQAFASDYMKQMADVNHPDHGDLAAVTEAMSIDDRGISPLQRVQTETQQRNQAQQASLKEFQDRQEHYKKQLLAQHAHASTAKASDLHAATARHDDGDVNKTRKDTPVSQGTESDRGHSETPKLGRKKK